MAQHSNEDSRTWKVLSTIGRVLTRGVTVGLGTLSAAGDNKANAPVLPPDTTHRPEPGEYRP